MSDILKDMLLYFPPCLDPYKLQQVGSPLVKNLSVLRKVAETLASVPADLKNRTMLAGHRKRTASLKLRKLRFFPNEPLPSPVDRAFFTTVVCLCVVSDLYIVDLRVDCSKHLTRTKITV